MDQRQLKIWFVPVGAPFTQREEELEARLFIANLWHVCSYPLRSAVDHDIFAEGRRSYIEATELRLAACLTEHKAFTRCLLSLQRHKNPEVGQPRCVTRTLHLQLSCMASTEHLLHQTPEALLLQMTAR
jgi:hypothetical protein